MEALVGRRTTELQKSEAKWRGLVEALPQLVWTTTPDGLCDYLSSQFVEYTGAQLQNCSAGAGCKTVHTADQPLVAARWRASPWAVFCRRFAAGFDGRAALRGAEAPLFHGAACFGGGSPSARLKARALPGQGQNQGQRRQTGVSVPQGAGAWEIPRSA